MRTIVSFTSYPPRINGVHKVVESLYRQTVQADEIILYLSLDEFPEAELPEALTGLIGRGGFRIEWVQGNLKSHKKYYYALQEYRDAVIITVDDDTIYARTMIDDLLKSYKRFPNAVSSRRARMILRREAALEPYSKWERDKYIEEYADMPRMDLCAIGVGGICYPPVVASGKWFDQRMIVDTAGEHDDLWMKYNEIINNIPVVYTKPSQEDVTLDGSQTCRLSDHNLYGSGNDDCIFKLLILLRELANGSYQRWFRGLMTREEYIIAKKRYYVDIFRTIFDKVWDVPVYFYGAGEVARRILMILSDLGLTQRITAIIVSDKSGNPSSLYGLQIRALSELDTNRKFGVFFGVGEANRKEIIDRLVDYDYINIGLSIPDGNG